MSESDDLKRRLAALARTDDTYVDGARVISRGGAPSPLQALLGELDETVMTRDLTFAFGDVGSIVLVAAGRRLLGVREIDRLAMPAIAQQLAGQQITGEDDPHLKALIGVLLPLDLLSETVTVTSKSVEWTGPETGTGLGMERLATRLSVDYPFVPTTRLDQFRTRLGAMAMASMQRTEDGSEVSHGDEADLDWLQSNAGAFLSSAQPTAPGPKMAVLGQLQDGKRALAAAFDGSETLIWVQDGGKIPAVSAVWHSIFLA